MTVVPSLDAILESLAETCRNSQQTYETAAGEVQNLALKSLLEEYASRQSDFCGELSRITPQFDRQRVNHATQAIALPADFPSLRSALDDGDEEAIISKCLEVEDGILSQYREVLHLSLPAEVQNVVMRQFESLLSSESRLEALGAAAAGL